MEFTDFDKLCMRRAIKLALLGKGKVKPNPMVGAVITKDGKIIAEGYHKKFGGLHAEIEAINNTKCSLEGSSMYVTLEPCCHYGKTPPCTESIKKAKIHKVVIGMKDPNLLVNGKGIKCLKEFGIEVEVGDLEEEVKCLLD